MTAFSKGLNLALAILLLLFIACENKFDSSVKTPITHSHDYLDEHTHDHHEEDHRLKANHNPLVAKKFDEKFAEKYNRSTMDRQRDDWQKPQTVISSFGDFKDKTIADIGAGEGYFSLYIARLGQAKKVIAIDIDEVALANLNVWKTKLPKDLQERFEGRVCSEDDPKLKEGEADIVIIVNTYTFLENRVAYLKNLKKGIAKGGKLFIIDYKRKALPLPVPDKDKLALYQVESEVEQAGYRFVSDDQTLEYQYIVMAVND